MGKLRYSIKAVEDLSSIWSYTVETWSEKQADTYYSTLISSCELIATDPLHVGRNYEHIVPYLRGYKVGKHIIFYMLKDDAVLIVRILHEQMDLRNRLGE